MSLHFTLHVNGRGIYHAMDIQRLDSTDTNPTGDSVFQYRARAVTENGVDPATQMSAVVTHRYGDGAWELVRKALNAMLDLDRPGPDGRGIDLTPEEAESFEAALKGEL